MKPFQISTRKTIYSGGSTEIKKASGPIESKDTESHILSGRMLFLNSKKLGSTHIMLLSESLGLSTSSCTEELRQLIDGKQTKMHVEQSVGMVCSHIPTIVCSQHDIYFSTGRCFFQVEASWLTSNNYKAKILRKINQKGNKAACITNISTRCSC